MGASGTDTSLIKRTNDFLLLPQPLIVPKLPSNGEVNAVAYPRVLLLLPNDNPLSLPLDNSGEMERKGGVRARDIAVVLVELVIEWFNPTIGDDDLALTNGMTFDKYDMMICNYFVVVFKILITKEYRLLFILATCGVQFEL